MKKIVGVVFGGRSGEHEVSIQSSKSVIEALKQADFQVVPIFIEKNGQWTVDGKKVTLTPSPGGGLHTNTAQKPIPIDIYFPVLHGTFGEDGTIQGLFEMAGVPYVGAGVLGSAVGMDKEAQKLLYLYHGIPTAQFEVVHRLEWEKSSEEVLRRVERSVGFPCFVKPANLGSSVGVSKVTKKELLPAAIKKALRFDTKILAEEFIKGREIVCGVIGNDEVKVSLPGEVVTNREFYDYVAKYVADDTQYKVGVPLKSELHEKVMRLAAQVYQATFCQGLARVDFFLTPADELYVVEINTIPGFTSHSMFPKLWDASGLPFPKLVTTLVDLGFSRWKERNTLQTNTQDGELLR